MARWTARTGRQPLGKVLLIALGVAALVLGVIWGGLKLYRSMNYQVVQAEVLGDEPGCVLSRSGSKTRSSDQTGFLTCEEAEQRRASGSYSNYRVREVERLTLRYVSPADNQEHEASLLINRGAYGDIAAGNRVEIRAHIREPGTIISMEGP